MGIEAFRIVAYAYDAAYHCKGHAEKQFGLENGKDWVKESAIDSEGNPVHPVFSSDQDYDTVAECDDNWKEIICLVCGVYDSERKAWDECWNCGSAWVNDGDERAWNQIMAPIALDKPRLGRLF